MYKDKLRMASIPFGIEFVDIIKEREPLGLEPKDQKQDLLYTSLRIGIAKDYVPASFFNYSILSSSVVINVSCVDFFEGISFPKEVTSLEIQHGYGTMKFKPIDGRFFPKGFVDYIFLGAFSPMRIVLEGITSLEGISLLVGYVGSEIRTMLASEKGGYPFSIFFTYGDEEYEMYHGYKGGEGNAGIIRNMMIR